ncbi:MAG: glycosyltransferase family protein [Thermodesulfobacteriota bacterium]
MRILALRPKGRILPHIHESMVKAFRNLGVEVDNVSISAKKNEFSLIKDILKGDYQAIFTINMGEDQNFIASVREWQIKYRRPWVMWFVDDPEGYNFPQAYAPSYTLAFCWDRGIVEEMVRVYSEWGGYMHHLPLATDPEIFFPEKNTSPYPWRGIFVGVVSHPNKLFAEIMATNLELQREVENLWKIYSRDFSMPLPNLLWERVEQKLRPTKEELRSNWLARLWVKVVIYQLAIKKRTELVGKVLNGGDGVFGDQAWLKFLKRDLYQGQITYGEELRKIYSQTSFVLDIRPGQSRTGLTQRIFDASACGATVLTEWSPELEHLFDLKEIFSFRNLDEAEQMRDLIILDIEKAKKKAQEIKDKVLSKHTYYNRARAILECLKKF